MALAGWHRWGAAWLDPDRTFGVELELADRRNREPRPATYRSRARALRSALVRALGPERVYRRIQVEPRAVDRSYAHWNVVPDETAGWEVTSPVLRGISGLREVERACGALLEVAPALQLRPTFRTGTHIHIGWADRDYRTIKRLVRWIKLFEPALATIVEPTRVARFDGRRFSTSEPNRLCQPISSVLPRDMMRSIRSWEQLVAEARSLRHVTVSLAHLDDLRTIEVRWLGGTLATNDIAVWLSLWQQIAWLATSRPGSPRSAPDTDIILPHGDIVALAQRYLPGGRDPRFIDWLERRRVAVAAEWRRHASLRGHAAFARTPPRPNARAS
jgi:hypothetical protein